MVRISIPSIGHNHHHPVSATPIAKISKVAAVDQLSSFLAARPGRAALLTGAGVSVDSGIRPYRGEDGRYMNPNYQPILYQQIMAPTQAGFDFRQRYWARSYLGYPPVRDALPNPTHFALAALKYTSHIAFTITQNVDGLHSKAHQPFMPSKMDQNSVILELHGTLFSVHCRHQHKFDRDEFQVMLSQHNPTWRAFADRLERTGEKLRTNPDGDIELAGMDWRTFRIPPCPVCLRQGRTETVIKPDLVFFGESILPEVRTRSFRDVDECERLLVIGTTLATYSAFRIVQHALAGRKPVLLLNLGPTRADALLEANTAGISKVDISAGDVLDDVVKQLCGSQVETDPMVQHLLSAGVITPIEGR